jgi:predicted AAA+ superfamily ATPase
MDFHTPVTRNALSEIRLGFAANPVVALLGPRQCGKSTLAREYAKKTQKETHFFDLEDPRDLEALKNPLLTLDQLDGLIVIDEIQRAPNLFPYLRTLVDKKKRKIKLLILGSASHELLKQSSESLAGRLSTVELTPLLLSEVNDQERLHRRGGFPLSFLAKSEKISSRWRQEYVSTFLERDLYEFGFRIAPATLRRFWMMLTHYHGQILNYAELARSFGISDMTARHYIEILTQTFMVRLLPPWYENISKRQVKAPKLYLRDSGILHSLLDIESVEDLRTHPKLGASWEGFALEQVIAKMGIRSQDAYFWSTHSHAEIDLLTFQGSKRIGYEFKYSDTPKITASMQIAMEDLKLDRLVIVTPQGRSHKLSAKISSASLQDC